MAGFSNITGDESIMFADNASFDGTERAGKLTTNGQLWIGSTASPHVQKGILTSPDGSVVIGYSSPNITLKATSGVTNFTADSGTAVPSAGNINVLGGPGVTTIASGSTINVRSVVFTDTAAATLVKNNGYFATAAGTYTLPASPSQGDLIHVVCQTSGAVAVTAAGSQIIQLGNAASSAGGSMTSTAKGDSLTLRYRTSDTTWYTTASMGNWTPA
jgi:hypothetical protein